MASAPKTPSLYARMQMHGTLTETPRDVPDARFALPSTIHWMRALAILAADQKLDFASARTFYAKVQTRGLPERELNTVCEQLLFGLNQIAALQTLATATNKADVARTAIATAPLRRWTDRFRTTTRRPRGSGRSGFRPRIWRCIRSPIAFRAFCRARPTPNSLR